MAVFSQHGIHTVYIHSQIIATAKLKIQKRQSLNVGKPEEILHLVDVVVAGRSITFMCQNDTNNDKWGPALSF